MNLRFTFCQWASDDQYDKDQVGDGTETAPEQCHYFLRAIIKFVEEYGEDKGPKDKI